MSEYKGQWQCNPLYLFQMIITFGCLFGDCMYLENCQYQSDVQLIMKSKAKYSTNSSIGVPAADHPASLKPAAADRSAPSRRPSNTRLTAGLVIEHGNILTQTCVGSEWWHSKRNRGTLQRNITFLYEWPQWLLVFLWYWEHPLGSKLDDAPTKFCSLESSSHSAIRVMLL